MIAYSGRAGQGKCVGEGSDTVLGESWTRRGMRPREASKKSEIAHWLSGVRVGPAKSRWPPCVTTRGGAKVGGGEMCGEIWGDLGRVGGCRRVREVVWGDVGEMW